MKILQHHTSLSQARNIRGLMKGATIRIRICPPQVISDDEQNIGATLIREAIQYHTAKQGTNKE